MTSPSNDDEPIIQIVGRPTLTLNQFRKSAVETMFEVWQGAESNHRGEELREGDLLFEWPDWTYAVEAAERVRLETQRHDVFIMLRSRWLVWDGEARAFKRRADIDKLFSERFFRKS